MASREIQKAYSFSIKGVVAKITLGMSILSIVRFAVDLYQLPLTLTLRNILATYQAIFHTCIDVLLIWLPYRLPAWGKDLLIFYSLFGFIFLRVLFHQAKFNYRHPWIIQHNFAGSRVRFFLRTGWGLFINTFLWPVRVRKLFSLPYLVVAAGAHGPSGLYFSKDRPIEGQWRGFYIGDARLMLLIRLGLIILGALLVTLFNYAFSV